ncbi:MAG: hypothetical protein COV66_13300 [Nitrospinae bacterium CG11_big_fil_rev_8_21_14_0_20_45_15]|nr:MAG: hypothetical protein COV66_13300 [Nitrospinae bacterium CG11_big_fil_rev_8_21_14_0_20_45_15]
MLYSVLKKTIASVSLILGILGVASPGYSETYIGIGAGASIPENFRHVSLDGSASASHSLNVILMQSIASK